MPTLEELRDTLKTAKSQDDAILSDLKATVQIAKSRFELSPEEVKSVQQSMPPKGFAETVAGNTTLGLAARAANRAYVGKDYIEPAEGDFGTAGNLAAELGSIVADPVFMGAGGLAAKGATKLLGKRVVGETLKRTAARGAIAGAGTLGAVSGIQEPLTQYRQTGEMDPEQAAIAAGKGAVLGAALGPAGVVGEKVLPRVVGEGIERRIARAATSAGAETAALGIGSPALEGKLPTEKDFLHAATIVLGMKGIGKITELRRRFATRTETEDPRKIAEDVLGKEDAEHILQTTVENFQQLRQEPLTKQDMLSPDGAALILDRNPAFAQQLTERKFTREAFLKELSKVSPARGLESWSEQDRQQMADLVRAEQTARSTLPDTTVENPTVVTQEKPTGPPPPLAKEELPTPKWAMQFATVYPDKAEKIRNIQGDVTIKDMQETREPGPLRVLERSINKDARNHLRDLLKGIHDASQTGNIEENNQQQYQNRDEARQVPETGDSNRPVQSGQVQETKVPVRPSVQASPSSQGIIPGPNDVALNAIAGQMRSGWNVVKAIGRAFRARQDLPQEAFDQNLVRQGNYRARIKQGEFDLHDLQKAVRKDYGVKWNKLDESVNNDIERALEGDKSVQLPEATAAAVNVMRANLDAGMQTISDMYPDGSRLKAILRTADPQKGTGPGIWIRRSYKAFHDPTWAENVPQDVKDRFKQQLVNEYPDATPDELDGIINKILGDARASKSPLGFLSQSRLGSKDLSSLIKRKDLSEALRGLLGEEKNPFVNYARSVQNQSQLIANHQFLTQVQKDGMGSWIFDKPTGEFSAEIATPGSEVMNPLNGKYTRPEIAAEFARWNTQPQVGPFMQWYYRALMLAKSAKTVYSHASVFRNAPANTMIEIGQGNIALQRMGKPLQGMLAELGWSDKPPSRDYAMKMLRLGIWDDSAGIRELFDIVQRAGGKSLDDILTSPGQEMLTKLKQLGPKLWLAVDNIPKAFGWETEKARYRKAFPDWSEAQVEAKAAEIVRNTRPTYSLLPPVVKTLSRSPLGQSFIAWRAERIRNQFHTIKLIQEELSDPRTRSIGARRLVGTLAVESLMLGGISTGLRWLLGLSKQDQKDAERFTQSYQKNAPIALTDADHKGHIEYMDLSFTDPNAIIHEPLMAMLRGENWVDKFKRTAEEFSNTFFGENLITAAVIDSIRGETAEGVPVYNPQDTALRKAGDIASRLGEPFVPGSVTSADRLKKALTGTRSKTGKIYDPKLESIAQFGFRVQRVSVAEQLLYKAAQFGEDLKNAYGIQRDLQLSRGEVADAELVSAAGRSKEAVTRLVGEMHEDVMAAIRQGVSRENIAEIAQAAGLGRAELGAIMANNPQRYQLDADTIRQALRRTNATRGDVQKRLEELQFRNKTVQEAIP